jgi:hypothetical protein
MIVKTTALIASIPEREQMLERTVRSLRNQVNDLRVTLNDYDHIPKFLNKKECIILDNSLGDAGKFYFADQFKGYIFTCDDDLIYPSDYVRFMIAGIKRHNCVVTLHGRNYLKLREYIIDGRKVKEERGFQSNFEGYPCLGEVIKDTQVNVGGDGVMCYHTDLINFTYNDFKSKNMSQLWVAKKCKEQGMRIMVLAHKADYLKYQMPSWTIWDEANKEGFKEQTALLKTFL